MVDVNHFNLFLVLTSRTIKKTMGTYRKSIQANNSPERKAKVVFAYINLSRVAYTPPRNIELLSHTVSTQKKLLFHCSSRKTKVKTE